MSEKSKRGFASMSPERVREIASLGGRSIKPENRTFSKNRGLAQSAGRAGGKLSGGNFANNPEAASIAGRKGGQASAGNFKNNIERASSCGRMKRKKAPT